MQWHCVKCKAATGNTLLFDLILPNKLDTQTIYHMQTRNMTPPIYGHIKSQKLMAENPHLFQCHSYTDNIFSI
jgi:hypothetical protein